MKLFAIYIGGELAAANIEVHDMRFVVASSIDQTYEQLKREWWGRPGSLHIDCWAEVDHVDGYEVDLRERPAQTDEKLFYVNLGGYDPAEFSEQHKNMFVVATSVAEAKARALRSVRNWDAPHRDDFYEAEQAFCLDEDPGAKGLHIHLTQSREARALKFKCEYTPIR